MLQWHCPTDFPPVTKVFHTYTVQSPATMHAAIKHLKCGSCELNFNLYLTLTNFSHTWLWDCRALESKLPSSRSQICPSRSSSWWLPPWPPHLHHLQWSIFSVKSDCTSFAHENTTCCNCSLFTQKIFISEHVPYLPFQTILLSYHLTNSKNIKNNFPQFSTPTLKFLPGYQFYHSGYSQE